MLRNKLKVPWENPSISARDFRALNKLAPYSKETAAKVVSSFEYELASYVGSEHAIAVNNGSSALICALLANGVSEGDFVAVPTYTFASVVNSIIMIGAKPILVDSNLQTFNMDLDQLDHLSRKYKVKACIHVDVGGHPPDLDKLYDFCKDVDMVLVEDGAEALGSEYKGKLVGNFDHTTTLSFHPAKQMTTLEGGAIITNDKNLAEKLRIIRNHGMSATYDHVELGFNFRMAPFEAAFGISQLESINRFIKKRQAIAGKYLSGLEGLLEFQKIMPYVTDFSWGAFLALLQSPVERDRLLEQLQGRGIEARVMWKPVHLQQYHSFLSQGDYPMAEQIFGRVLSLPIGNGMSMHSVDYVVDTINELLGQT